MKTGRVDFTALPAGARTRGLLRVQRCPVCGRNGEVRRFTDHRTGAGAMIVTHIGRLVRGLLAGAPDSCWIETGKPKAE